MGRLLAVVPLLGAMLLSGCAGDRSAMPMHRANSQGGARGLTFAWSMMGPMPRGYRAHALTCSPPATLPGTTVGVMLGDRGMTRMMSGTAPAGVPMMLRAAPDRAPAGQVSFVVANMGWRVHELVILPLAPDRSAGQRAPRSDGRVDESGHLGEASASCRAGAGDGLRPGTVGWVTVSLPRGHYELVCNLPHHYGNGMWQAFTVT